MHAEQDYIKEQLDLARAALRAIRLDKGYAIRELAALSEVDAATIFAFEAGKRTIRIDKLIALCMALEINIKDLWPEAK